MPVTSVTHDLDTATLTIGAEFAAPRTRVWQIYADPRQLERVWGPPECPATVVEHDFTPGGRVSYYMTGADGQRYPGYWELLEVDEPHGFSFRDGFADQELNPVASMPVSACTYAFVEVGGRTLASYVTVFDTVEDFQQVLGMGIVEGATGAINQLDGLLAA